MQLYHGLSKEDFKQLLKLEYHEYKSWSKKFLLENLIYFLKCTKQYMDFFELTIAPKAVVQEIYADLVGKFIGEELCKD